jgi:hypothetical protein
MRFRLHVPFFSFFFFVRRLNRHWPTGPFLLLTILNPIYNMYNISTMTHNDDAVDVLLGWGIFSVLLCFCHKDTAKQRDKSVSCCTATRRKRSLLYFAERIKRTKSWPLVVCVSRPTTFPAILPFATKRGSSSV